MTNGQKIAVFAGATAVVGLGAYLLLKPKKASGGTLPQGTKVNCQDGTTDVKVVGKTPCVGHGGVKSLAEGQGQLTQQRQEPSLFQKLLQTLGQGQGKKSDDKGGKSPSPSSTPSSSPSSSPGKKDKDNKEKDNKDNTDEPDLTDEELLQYEYDTYYSNYFSNQEYYKDYQIYVNYDMQEYYKDYQDFSIGSYDYYSDYYNY